MVRRTILRKLFIIGLVTTIPATIQARSSDSPPSKICDIEKQTAPSLITVAPKILADRFASLAQRTDELEQAGDDRKAKKSFERIWQLQVEHPCTDFLGMDEMLNRYGLLLERNEQRHKAQQVFADTIDLPPSNFGASGRLKARYNFARILARNGDISQALEQLKISTEEHRSEFGDRSSNTQIVRAKYAQYLRDVGQFDKAYSQIQNVLIERRKQLPDGHPKMLEALDIFGLILRDRGELQAAKDIQFDIWEKRQAGLGPDHPLTLASKKRHALTLVKLGQLNAARTAFEQLLQSYGQTLGDQHPETLNSMHNYSFALLKSQMPEPALAFAKKSLAAHESKFGLDHRLTRFAQQAFAEALIANARFGEAESLLSKLATDPSKDGLPVNTRMLSSHYWLARSRYEIPGMLSEGLSSLSEVTDYLSAQSQIAALSPAKGSNPLSAIKSKKFFELYADIGWKLLTQNKQKLGDDIQDFAVIKDDVFQKLQSVQNNPAGRALAKSAAKGHAAARNLLPVVEEREQVIEDIALNRSQQTSSLLGGDNIEELLVQNAQMLAKLQSLNQRLRSAAPDYFSFILPASLSQQALAPLLRDDETILLVIPTDLGTHIILADKDRITWHKSSWTREKIDTAARRLLWDIGANVDVGINESLEWEEEGSGAYPYDFETAHSLYQEIIAPIAKNLQGKSHIFVSASGSLSSLPLGILVKQVPKGDDGNPAVLRSAKWLADDFAIVQIPNVSSLRFIRAEGKKENAIWPMRFLGFGDPVLQGQSQSRGNLRSLKNRAKTPADMSALKKMARLPGTATELASIWSSFGKPSNALFLADQATETQIRNMDLNAEVIAFATHGLLAGEIGTIAEPGLVLTPPAQPGPADDGYLSTSDIAQLTIKSDWVILSACNTAGGDGRAGADGLSGLARSFFYAGAQTLLASHWPVRDDVAAKITVRMIEITKNDPRKTRAQALQQAMREIRNNPVQDTDSDSWAHPNAWAPFSLVGEP
ncbi:MAG: CHAT domain-containing tetratricopeptide repeat protein [Parasphingorhabdus sp.]|uniref:CHAT domain-containing protein n=1 Tax=Parasphingorhabdus sp. TaxID=2709688 RepID=UPI003297FE0E